MKLERQGISLFRDVCETQLILESSVLDSKTRCYVDGIPVVSQCLNTTIREVSVSDTTINL